MTDNTATIVLTDTAAAFVKADVAAAKKASKGYASYVAEMSVTADTLAAHVALFRDAFKESHPKSAPADSAAVKAYATKVRNGLRYHLPTVEKATADTDYLAALVKAATAAAEHDVDVMAALTEAGLV